jgi:E3 ubiquitin-protein ligase Topors
VDLDSPEFCTYLQPFFHEQTNHFLHELISFAKSPLDMPAYDNKVSYGLPQNKGTSTQVEENEETSTEQGNDGLL